jgi:hypothetical protein
VGSDDAPTEQETIFDFDVNTFDFSGYKGAEDAMAAKGFKWNPELLYEVVTDRLVGSNLICCIESLEQ